MLPCTAPLLGAAAIFSAATLLVFAEGRLVVGCMACWRPAGATGSAQFCVQSSAVFGQAVCLSTGHGGPNQQQCDSCETKDVIIPASASLGTMSALGTRHLNRAVLHLD